MMLRNKYFFENIQGMHCEALNRTIFVKRIYFLEKHAGVNCYTLISFYFYFCWILQLLRYMYFIFGYIQRHHIHGEITIITIGGYIQDKYWKY